MIFLRFRGQEICFPAKYVVRMNPYYTEPKDEHKPRALNLEIKFDFLSGIVQNKNKPLSGVCCYFDKPVATHGDPLNVVGDGINKNDTGNLCRTSDRAGCVHSGISCHAYRHLIASLVFAFPTHVMVTWYSREFGRNSGRNRDSVLDRGSQFSPLYIFQIALRRRHSSPEITGVVGESKYTGA